MTQKPSTRVAANVRAEMARHGLRGPEAAEALHLSQSAFSRRYRGYTEFTATQINTLATLLEIPVATLVADTDTDTALSVSA